MNHIKLLSGKVNGHSIKQSLPTVLLSLIFSICLFIACDDIIEKDLSDKEVFLFAPADSLKTKYGTQTFMWDWVDGAISYNLQIVTLTPLNHVEQLILDTTVTKNKFTVNLSPGIYEWGVSAMNGSSATLYFTRLLQIDSTLDLRNQKVTLNYPKEKYTTNSKKVEFGWLKLYNATSYYFELRPSDWNGSNAFYTKTTSIDTVTVLNIPEGTYEWAVKASNDNTSTNFTTSSIIIDRTAPAKPTLVSPANKVAITDQSVTLTWKRNETGASFFDSLYVAIDTFFTSNVSSYKVDTTFYNFSLSSDTTYFWKVKTVDAAGNVSGFDVRKFTKTQ